MATYEDSQFGEANFLWYVSRKRNMYEPPMMDNLSSIATFQRKMEYKDL